MNKYQNRKYVSHCSFVCFFITEPSSIKIYTIHNTFIFLYSYVMKRITSFFLKMDLHYYCLKLPSEGQPDRFLLRSTFWFACRMVFLQ